MDCQLINNQLLKWTILMKILLPYFHDVQINRNVILKAVKILVIMRQLV